jgi:hypothetical protein
MRPPADKNHQQQVHACGTRIPKLMPYNVESATKCMHAYEELCTRCRIHDSQAVYASCPSTNNCSKFRAPQDGGAHMGPTNNLCKQLVQRWTHTQINEWHPSVLHGSSILKDLSMTLLLYAPPHRFCVTHQAVCRCKNRCHCWWMLLPQLCISQPVCCNRSSSAAAATPSCCLACCLVC